MDKRVENYTIQSDRKVADVIPIFKNQCGDKDCDVAWIRESPVWRRAVKKGDSVVICSQCHEKIHGLYFMPTNA